MAALFTRVKMMKGPTAPLPPYPPTETTILDGSPHPHSVPSHLLSCTAHPDVVGMCQNLDGVECVITSSHAVMYLCHELQSIRIHVTGQKHAVSLNSGEP